MARPREAPYGQGIGDLRRSSDLRWSKSRFDTSRCYELQPDIRRRFLGEPNGSSIALFPAAKSKTESGPT